MTRLPLIAGNWKMYKTAREGVEAVHALKPLAATVTGVDIVVCPPFTALADVGRALAGSNIELGAQDLHWEAQGAYTGEVSGPMLWDLGCTYVIVGHSERRRHFRETDEEIGRKTAAAFAHELFPILCVGETLEERDAGRTEEVVERQVRLGIAGLDPTLGDRLVVAYEPVWAIGTGRAATGEEANRVSILIRGWLAERLGDGAQGARILYGGSVTVENAGEFLGQPEIDGALVGGASLDPHQFSAIVMTALRPA